MKIERSRSLICFVGRAIGLVETLIVAVVIVVAGMLIIPRIAGVVPYVVMSSSMSPTFDAGAVSFIDMNEKDVQIGDVIAYQLGEELITHRIIDEDEAGRLICQGDNNEVPDLAPVSRSQVVGKNIFQIPYLGFVLTFFKTIRGKIIVLTAGVAYLLLQALESLLSGGKEFSEKKRRN